MRATLPGDPVIMTARGTWLFIYYWNCLHRNPLEHTPPTHCTTLFESQARAVRPVRSQFD
jgi:hypothetical protein